jgi:hypothetical protein
LIAASSCQGTPYCEPAASKIGIRNGGIWNSAIARLGTGESGGAMNVEAPGVVVVAAGVVAVLGLLGVGPCGLLGRAVGWHGGRVGVVGVVAPVVVVAVVVVAVAVAWLQRTPVVVGFETATQVGFVAGSWGRLDGCGWGGAPMTRGSVVVAGEVGVVAVGVAGGGVVGGEGVPVPIVSVAVG